MLCTVGRTTPSSFALSSPDAIERDSSDVNVTNASSVSTLIDSRLTIGSRPTSDRINTTRILSPSQRTQTKTEHATPQAPCQRYLRSRRRLRGRCAQEQEIQSSSERIQEQKRRDERRGRERILGGWYLSSELYEQSRAELISSASSDVLAAFRSTSSKASS